MTAKELAAVLDSGGESTNTQSVQRGINRLEALVDSWLFALSRQLGREHVTNGNNLRYLGRTEDYQAVARTIVEHRVALERRVYSLSS